MGRARAAILDHVIDFSAYIIIGCARGNPSARQIRVRDKLITDCLGCRCCPPAKRLPDSIHNFFSFIEFSTLVLPSWLALLAEIGTRNETAN